MTLKPLSHAARSVKFGVFPFTPAPLPANPERVRVPTEWSLHHLREVMIPQLSRLPAAKRVLHSVTFHHLARQPVLDLWQAWEDAGLLPAVHTWNGSWVCRFKRQRGTVEQRIAKCRTLKAKDLSNHSWGTAFDINAQELPLGTPRDKVPADVVEMARIANDLGWSWGGDYGTRPDPMHFEYVGK